MNFFIAENLFINKTSSYTFPLVEEINKGTISLPILNDFEKADIVVIPTSVAYLLKNNKTKEFYDISKKTKESEKRLLIFSGGDYGITFKEPHIIQVRLGGFKSKMSRFTYIMPPFIEDPYKKTKLTFSTLQKKDFSTMGFVGHSNGNLLNTIKEFLLHTKSNLKRVFKRDYTDIQKFYPSSRKRFQYLEFLQKSNEIKTDFIYKKKYRAGAKTAEERYKTANTFYKNIFENIYTFCLRGTGNFSVRFYETLAMGRIPVLINSDCKLPFEDIIPWNNHILVINENEVDTLLYKLSNFHKTHSNEEIVAIQKRNRALWETYFTRETYFYHLIKDLTK